MSRGVWFAAGLGAGVYAAVRARRVAEAFTPDGARDRLAGLRHGARLLAGEYASGAAQGESDLRERLGLEPAPARGLTPGAASTGAAGTIPASGATPPPLGRGRPALDADTPDPDTTTRKEGHP